MSSYFDACASSIRDALGTPYSGTFNRLDTFHQIEKTLVRDCTIAAMLPGFPEDLRLAVHRAVLRHGIVTLPDNAEPADFETDAEHARRLRDLCSDLHDVFHAVAHATDLGDHPVTALDKRFYWPGQEERERLVEEDKKP